MNETFSGDAGGIRAESRIRRIWCSLSSPRWSPILLKVVLGAGALVLLAFIGGRVRPSGATSAEQIAAADLAMVTTAVARAAAAAVPVGCDASGVGPACAKTPGTTSDGKVILNVASIETLTTLPGVGPARARAIVDLRERLGRFRRLEDLLRIRGIGARSLQKLRPLVVLDQAPAES